VHPNRLARLQYPSKDKDTLWCDTEERRSRRRVYNHPPTSSSRLHDNRESGVFLLVTHGLNLTMIAKATLPRRSDWGFTPHHAPLVRPGFYRTSIPVSFRSKQGARDIGVDFRRTLQLAPLVPVVCLAPPVSIARDNVLNGRMSVDDMVAQVSCTVA